MSEHPESKMQRTSDAAASNAMHAQNLLVILARPKKQTGEQRTMELKVNDV